MHADSWRVSWRLHADDDPRCSEFLRRGWRGARGYWLRKRGKFGDMGAVLTVEGRSGSASAALGKEIDIASGTTQRRVVLVMGGLGATLCTKILPPILVGRLGKPEEVAGLV